MNNKKEVAGIFRPWRKHPKTGQILWAKNYGKKAWFIPLSEIEAEKQE